MSDCLVFFRNDDVNRIEPGLVEVTDLLHRYGAGVAHAVEPANLTGETRDWLLERTGQGVEIIQHGFSHTWHDVGEFGGSRSRADQQSDLVAGRQAMAEAFGDEFFRAMSFPFGAYNRHSMELIDSLGYEVVSCAWRHRWKTRAFCAAGRAVGRGRLLNRHVSHHLRRYPGTGLAEISVTISPIASYHGPREDRSCRFRTQAELRSVFGVCRRLTPVVGVVLHHRFHADPTSLAVLADFLSWLADQPGVRFGGLADAYREHFPPTGLPGSTGAGRV